METAKAQIEAAQAGVEAATAAVETAQVNLGFTHLTSPIDGIAGMAQVAGRQPGEPGQRRRSPRFPRSIRSRPISPSASRSISASRGSDISLGRLQLDLILSDGTHLSAQRHVSLRRPRRWIQSTGSIQLTGAVPQSRKHSAARAVRQSPRRRRNAAGALLVPQRAVTELQGNYLVAVVDDEQQSRHRDREGRRPDRLGCG